MDARRQIRAALLTVIGAGLGFRAAPAQAPGCTYVRCALRLEGERAAFGTPRLVQGLEARPVATIGFFAPRISLLELSPDSVQQPYRAFRRDVNTGGLLWVLGAATALASTLFWGQAAHGRPGAMIGLIGGGFALSIAGIVERGRGAADLRGAVSRYNEALPDGR